MLLSSIPATSLSMLFLSLLPAGHMGARVNTGPSQMNPTASANQSPAGLPEPERRERLSLIGNEQMLFCRHLAVHIADKM